MINHAFTATESELVFDLLETNKITTGQIEELLELLRPGVNEFYYQQAVAGLIAEIITTNALAVQWNLERGINIPQYEQ